VVAAALAAILPMRTCAFFAQVIFFAQKHEKTAFLIISRYDKRKKEEPAQGRQDK